MANALTAERLRELVHYDPETGVFTKRLRHSARWTAGRSLGWIQRRWGYRHIKLDGREYKAHRLAFLYMTGAWPAEGVDHINGQKADNRWANLRDADKSENGQNRVIANPKSTTGFLGAHLVSPGRWQARITLNRVVHYLGRYDSPEAAHAAYLKAKRELHPFMRPPDYRRGVVHDHSV